MPFALRTQGSVRRSRRPRLRKLAGSLQEKFDQEDSLRESGCDDESEGSGEGTHEEDDREDQSLHTLRGTSVRYFVHRDVYEYLSDGGDLRRKRRTKTERGSEVILVNFSRDA